MEPGAAVWVRDSGPETWVPGTILRKVPCGDDLYEMEVDLVRGGKTSFKISAGETEVADLKLRNSSDVSLVEDLITLPHLHEPAILHSLWERFNHGDIYTFTGPILIAVNPFKRLPLYTEEKLMTYYEHGLLATQGLKMSSSLAPHVYAIADAAYRAMMDAIRNRPPAGASVVGSQSILISGESGAGKTESTKVVMKYLTTVGAPEGSKADATDTVMQKVLQSNPILEAFGNARTIRNDNSSRFGKFIELHFDKRGHLLGASIQTYLLEKVRLPNQSANERNFHIFYQLCAGASAEQRERLRLADVTEYHYTSQGQCFTLRQVDDADEFSLTSKAMNTLGFSPDMQTSILEIVGGLLHLGQVTFKPDASGEGSELEADGYVQTAFANAADLIHLSRDYLRSTLTTRVVETRGESFTVKLKAQQAVDARDALAKALYGKLFNAIVAKINACIATDLKDSRATVSVLDIFGFECFLNNSFEQLCINYCNEMLQQQFNQFVFKMEQEEYEKEGISWSFISFPDNQDCLDLIEGKPSGVLAMLDDECRLPKGSDENYAGRLYKAYTTSKRFFVTNKMKPLFLFGVRHYAGEVSYNTAGFLEKNKDQLPKEAYNLFLSSDCHFIQDLFNEQKQQPGQPGSQQRRGSGAGISSPQGLAKPGGAAPGSGGMSAPTVATQFKQQLNELMQKIHTTRPHYIRCLKPNDELVADKFNRARVNEQLRYGGVLEAVRVARSGYPVRLPHPEFYSRYRCLATVGVKAVAVEGEAKAGILGGKKPGKLVPFPAVIKGDNFEASRQWCQQVLDAILAVQEAQGEGIEKHKVLERESVQLGKTKIFLRKTAYEVLEFKRTSRLTSAAVKIQAFFRAATVRREYAIIRAAACRLQRVLRGMQGRKVARHLRWNRASLRVQTAFRRHVALRRYQRFRHAVVALQCQFRGLQARRALLAMIGERSAFKLQAWYRMACARRRYRRYRRWVVAMQCGFRMRVAKRQLRELRLAAREIGNLQANNEKLKEELAQLREQLMKKAELDRLEKERQLAEEKAAAAAAVLDELEQWKVKYYDLERTYQEEKTVREGLEVRVEVLVAESKQKDIVLASEKETAAKYEEQCRRLQTDMTRYEADLEAMQKQLHQSKAAYAALAESGSRAPPPLSSLEAALALPPPSSPLLSPRSRGSSMDRSLQGMSHKLLHANSPRASSSSSNLSSTASLAATSRQGSGKLDGLDMTSSAALISDSSEDKEQEAAMLAGDEAAALASSAEPALVMSAALDQQHAEAKPADDQHQPLPPTPREQAAAPSLPPAPVSPRPGASGLDKLSLSTSSRSLMGAISPRRKQQAQQHGAAPAASSPDMNVGGLVTPGSNRRASITIRHVGSGFSDSEDGEGDVDELDDVVDLEDKDQDVNVYTLRRNRQQALEKLVGRLRTFRAEMVQAGVDVKVLEIGRMSTFAPMRMKLADCTGSEDDVVKGRVVFEAEKPKKSLVGSWFQSEQKSPVVPDPIKFSELYGVIRGYRRVRWAGGVSMEASVADDQHKLLTFITLETPQDDSRRRGVVVLFEKREARNHTLEGLRRLLHDMFYRVSMPPGTPTLASHALTVKGYPHGQVVPFDRAQQMVSQARSEQQMALAQLVDATNDLALLEDEVRCMEHERKRLVGEIQAKEVELHSVQQECEKARAERFKLARTSNEQSMEISELKEQLGVQKMLLNNMERAMGAQFDEEKDMYQKRLDSEMHVNKELQDKMLKVQMENVDHKEEVRRLKEQMEKLDAMLRQAKAELLALQAERQALDHSHGLGTSGRISSSSSAASSVALSPSSSARLSASSPIDPSPRK